MYDLFNIIGLMALGSGLFFLIYGIVCAVKKKGKKKIIFSFIMFIVFICSALLFSYLGNAFNYYDSAMYEIKRTKPLEYSLESAMHDFEKAGFVNDSAQSHRLLFALFNEKDPEVFIDKAEVYFSNQNSSIKKQDLCRHMYCLLAGESKVPVDTAWKYYRSFLYDYIKDMRSSDKAVSEGAFDRISDTDGKWLSDCGKNPEGKAAVYVRYKETDLKILGEAPGGISLRYQHMLDAGRLPFGPEQIQYIIFIDYELVCKGNYLSAGKTAYQQSAAVSLYNAADMQPIEYAGRVFGEDVPDSIQYSGNDKGGEYIIGGDIDEEELEELIEKAVKSIDAQ